MFTFDESCKLHFGMRILTPLDMHILLVYNSTQVECGFITEDEVCVEYLIFELRTEVIAESHPFLKWPAAFAACKV